MKKRVKLLLFVISIMSFMILFPMKAKAATSYDNITFSGEYYLDTYSDLRNAFGNNYQAAYNHFITFGIREGRQGSPYFDVNFYLENNGDLRNAFGNNYQAAYNHFITCGIKEGRQGSLCLDINYYLNYYEDLRNAFKGNFEMAVNHFMTCGIREGRRSSPYFDVGYYFSKNSDLKKAFKTNYEAGYNHFMTFGIKEGRRGSEYFDVGYYLNNNSDLKKAFNKNYKGAYNHYIAFGITEGRNPSEKVNIKCYINSYNDLKKSFGKNYKKAAEHYYIFGVKEGRRANHTIIDEKARAATCTQTGLTAGKKCKTCGEIIERQKETQKLNHDFKESERKEATCTEDGYIRYKCTRCNETKEEKINKIGHNWEKKECTWTNTTSAKAKFVCKNNSSHIEEIDATKIEKTKETATCENDGETEYTATFEFEGKTYTDKKTEKTSALGHDWGDWKKENDMYYRECSRCHTKEEGKISKFSVTDGKDNEKLKENYGWKIQDGYNTTFSTTGDIVKVTGLIPLYSEEFENGKKPFSGDAKTGYYLAFKITTEETTTENTTVEIMDGYESDKSTKAVKSDFDDDTNLYVLKHLHLSDTKKTFKIKIDLDGEDGTDYNPYTITVDWSGLKLQVDSTSGSDYEPVDSSKIDTEDKKTLEETWGYNFSLDNITYTIGSQPDIGSYHTGLEGTVKEQALKAAAGFGEDKGYYVPVKITIPIKDLAKEYHDKWTIYLKNGNGEEYVEKKPSATDYKNGYIVVLFKMKNGTEGIHYKVDYDGSEGNDYLISNEITIKTNFTFLSSHEVIFDYKNVATQNEKITVWDGDKISEDKIPETNPESDDVYHGFAYWNKEDGTKFDAIQFANKEDKSENTAGKETGDITLVPHWNLYSDKFISDVINDLNSTDESSKSEDFSDKFVLEKSGENITIKVLDPTVSLSRMNETSIPGTIAYILLKDEIKEITLSVKGNDKTFTKTDGTNQETLKKAVQDGAKTLYSGILSENFDEKDDTQVTLSELANDTIYNSFTLAFDTTTIPKTITLAETPQNSEISLMSDSDITVPTLYTFTFDSDVIAVSNENDLKEAIQKGIKDIYINGDFNVTQPIDVNTDVNIHGAEHTLIASGELTSIFVVESNNVTIENIKLKDSKEAGIEVKSGTLTASNLTYEDENYNNPVVRSNKTDATVNLTDIKGKSAAKLEEIYKITKYENQEEKSPKGDIKELNLSYNYHNYYNKEENSKIYETTIHNYEGSYRLDFVRYDYYNDIVQLPSKEYYKVLTEFNYEGEKYEAVGFTESRNYVVIKGDSIPTEVIEKGKLKATENKHYWVSYKVTLEEGTETVTDKESLLAALGKETVTKIIVAPTDGSKLIDLGSELTISRSILIVGKSADVTLKTNGIIVTADKVAIQRITLDFNDDKSEKEALINVKIDKASSENEICKFSLWQSTLKNTGNTVKNAVNYKAEKVAVDIRWCNFESPNISESYINVDGALSEGTEFYLNTFGIINGTLSNNINVITIKSFDQTAIGDDEETDVRIASNTIHGSGYMIKLLESTNNNKADIDFNYNKDSSGTATIAVECTTNEDFSNIKFNVKDYTKVKVVYVTGDKTQETPPESVKGVKIISEIEMVPQQEGISINGLSQEGNKVSGLISTQSADNKFYIPVQLTSNDFVDGVSTVSVTGPNDDTPTVYTYSKSSENGIAKVSNSNTMTLQLEAIKASKITGNHGKIYELELDVDGPNSNNFTVQNYTIDYSDVETIEEIILKAAENTQNAKSFTVEKDNKIKSGTEKFTIKKDNENGTQYYTENDGKIVQYTFPETAVNPEKKTNKKITVEKSEIINQLIPNKENLGSRPKLNDWTYFSQFDKIGTGIHELELLKDIVSKDGVVDAIKTVEKAEEENHTYIITVTNEKLGEWLNGIYLDGKLDENEQEIKNKNFSSETVTLQVTLDDEEQYVTELKTNGDFIIKNSEISYDDNKIDVKITEINKTTIQSPNDMLGKDGQQTTNEEIQNFIQQGRDWWSKYTGSETYKD